MHFSAEGVHTSCGNDPRDVELMHFSARLARADAVLDPMKVFLHKDTMQEWLLRASTSHMLGLECENPIS